MLLNPPLIGPRNGRVYKIVGVARVSDPREGKQDERSLDDQEAKLREWIKNHGIESFELSVLAGKGSGELLERAEFLQLLDAIESREPDLIIAEDLGRILRRVRAMDVCEMAEDCGVRLIAINDHVDTAQPNWRDAAFFAAFHHERSNRDTSDRIRRTLRSRFMNGEALRTPMYGFIKPADATNDAQMSKDPAAEAVYREWFAKLDSGASYAEVADWLNAMKVPLSPGARGDRWTPVMVARHTLNNPMLKGIREHNHRRSRRVNATGKYRTIKAEPGELLQRAVPHLAFFDAEYYDRVVAKVEERNAKYRRAKDGADPRKDVPKKRTRFPGQCMFCGVCGHMLFYGGHGQADHLVCDGARNYKCWNGATVDGPLAARKIAQAVFAEIERLVGFDTTLLSHVRDEAARLDSARAARLQAIARELADTHRELRNVLDFVLRGDGSESLRVEIHRLEGKRRALEAEQRHLSETPPSAIDIPAVDALKELARGAFAELAVDSFEFARMMRIIIPKIVVTPVRRCDGGPVRQRARFRLQLTNLLPDDRVKDVLRHPMEKILTVDLFDPARHEALRPNVVAMRASGVTAREVAAALELTVATAQKASALQRRIDRMGITGPYLPVTEPPADDGRFRRHLHPRFHFDPKPDAGSL